MSFAERADQLENALQHSAVSWLDWVVPLPAALLGAGVGALALLLIFRADRHARLEEQRRMHKERFESALADFMRELNKLANGLKEYQLAYGQFPTRFRVQVAMGGGGLPTPPQKPSDSDMWSSYEIAQMMGSIDERQVLNHVGSAVAVTSNLPGIEASGNLLACSGLLRIWRTGDVTADKAVSDLDEMVATAILRLQAVEAEKQSSPPEN